MKSDCPQESQQQQRDQEEQDGQEGAAEKRHPQPDKMLMAVWPHKSKVTEGEHPVQDTETEDEFDASELEERCHKEAGKDKLYEDLLTTDDDSL